MTMMIDELARIWKEAIVVYFSHSLSIGCANQERALLTTALCIPVLPMEETNLFWISSRGQLTKGVPQL